MAEIVFYRAKYGGPLDKTIAWLTWGEYSHVEFQLTKSPTGAHPCLSSSWRDGGVRWKRIDVTTGKWTRYMICPHYLAYPETELEIAEWMLTQENKKYDTLGVLLVPFTFWKNKLFRRARWFCSEICAHICREWKIFPFCTTQLSPSRMERICAANPKVFIRIPD